MKLFQILKTKYKIVKAARLFHQACAIAESEYLTTGHRHFLLYDPNFRKLVPVTYDKHPDCISYKLLKQRGQISGALLSQKQLKEKALYYTASLSGAKPCQGEELKEKLKLFVKLYLLRINP